MKKVLALVLVLSFVFTGFAFADDKPGKGSVIGAAISLVIFGVVKFGLGTLFGFADSAVNLSVGVILILSVLLPNLIEDWQNARRVAKRRAEAKA